MLQPLEDRHRFGLEKSGGGAGGTDRKIMECAASMLSASSLEVSTEQSFEEG
jgi:hypothetical protein